MTPLPDKHKKSTKSKAIKSPRIYIDPSAFILMRRRAFLTTEMVARLIDVTHRTVLNWENGKTRIPYAAFRVLKIKVGYLFDDEHFEDWFVRGDTLWSPEGRGFKPHELRYIGNYFWMARQWLAERALKQTENQQGATIPAGAASDVSPTSSVLTSLRAVEAGTRTSCGVAPHRESWPVPDMFFSLQNVAAPYSGASNDDTWAAVDNFLEQPMELEPERTTPLRAIFSAVSGEFGATFPDTDIDDVRDEPTIPFVEESANNPALRSELTNTPRAYA